MLMVVSYCWSERTSLANSRCRRGGSGRKRAFHEQQPIAQVVGMSSDPVAIPEIDRAEDWAKRSGETACQNLENRFGSPAR
jgi:hypothetical protein